MSRIGIGRPRPRDSANPASTEPIQGLNPEDLATAADPGSSSTTLWRLARSSKRYPALARTLAANPGLPRPLLWYLGRFGRWDVAVAVARNPRCPRRTQKWQAVYAHWPVRAALASDPSVDLRVLRRLVTGYQHEPKSLLHAATNPALDTEIVRILLGHTNLYVRGAAAAHPAASPDQLRLLADGLTAPAWVLRAVAANPSCPPDLSDQLLTWIALGGPGHSDPMFDPLECTGHPGNTDGALHAWYADEARWPGAYEHPLWRVRAAVAPANARVPIEHVRLLSRDPRPEVRRSVAGLVGVPVRNVREMMGDADPIVARPASFRLEENVKRARERRAKVTVGVAARLALPAAVLALTIANNFRSSFFSGQSSPVLPSSLAAVPATYACDTLLHYIATSPTGQADQRRKLPAGGWLACGSLSGGTHEVYMIVAAGRTGLTVRIPDTVISSRQRYVGGRVVVVPARSQAWLRLSDEVVASITPDKGPAIVIRLMFPNPLP
jgi:hypothetical protein